MVGPFLLRRVKTDPGILPDLPDRQVIRDDCTLTREQVGAYEAVAADMMGALEALREAGRRAGVRGRGRVGGRGRVRVRVRVPVRVRVRVPGRVRVRVVAERAAPPGPTRAPAGPARAHPDRARALGGLIPSSWAAVPRCSAESRGSSRSACTRPC